MLRNIEVRFATRTYEYISVNFDSIPTDEEYLKAKAFAEKHKNGIKPIENPKAKKCEHQLAPNTNLCEKCGAMYDREDGLWFHEVEE